MSAREFVCASVRARVCVRAGKKGRATLKRNKKHEREEGQQRRTNPKRTSVRELTLKREQHLRSRAGERHRNGLVKDKNNSLQSVRKAYENRTTKTGVEKERTGEDWHEGRTQHISGQGAAGSSQITIIIANQSMYGLRRMRGRGLRVGKQDPKCF